MNQPLIPYHSRSQALIDHAYSFARDAHGDQVRKYTGEPYITHPLAVAHIVASVTDDCNMICAAILHDVIEDTPKTSQDLMEAGFGHPVVNLVMWLTDVSQPHDGNRAFRKTKDLNHTRKATPDAKTIKLADLIHNAVDITQHDPNFARVFMREKALLLKVLEDGDEILFNRATDILISYQQRNLL